MALLRPRQGRRRPIVFFCTGGGLFILGGVSLNFPGASKGCRGIAVDVSLKFPGLSPSPPFIPLIPEYIAGIYLRMCHPNSPYGMHHFQLYQASREGFPETQGAPTSATGRPCGTAMAQPRHAGQGCLAPRARRNGAGRREHLFTEILPRNLPGDSPLYASSADL